MDYGIEQSWLSAAAPPLMCRVTSGRHLTSGSLGCLICTLDVMTVTYLAVLLGSKEVRHTKHLAQCLAHTPCLLNVSYYPSAWNSERTGPFLWFRM